MTTSASPNPSSLDADVLGYAQARGIEEILHFTTDKGLLGIMATRAVNSREGLNEDDYVQHIYTPNCRDRLKDAAWTGYVNLSVTRVNKSMLGWSKGWHAGGSVWWCVLAFDVQLLAQAGVYFSTSNNIYPATRRSTGASGLNELFTSSVAGRYGALTHRPANTPANLPTDPQAEVLFPGRVPLSWLRAIYVPDEENIDYVNSLFPTFGVSPRVPVKCKPEVFG
jgi:hypothetical protein